MEAKTADRLFSVDMSVSWRGIAVAVEVNGPSHFSASAPQRHLGSKSLRDGFVQARNFVVLNVAYYDWQATCVTPQAAHAYLWRGLERLVADRGRHVVPDCSRHMVAGRVEAAQAIVMAIATEAPSPGDGPGIAASPAGAGSRQQQSGATPVSDPAAGALQQHQQLRQKSGEAGQRLCRPNWTSV